MPPDRESDVRSKKTLKSRLRDFLASAQGDLLVPTSAEWFAAGEILGTTVQKTARSAHDKRNPTPNECSTHQRK